MISRSFLAAVCLATSSFAAPPLTTIQDVLFKADGTRFHGTLSISWTSFEAIDRSAIAQQTTTVTVVNGNLQVQLVPTTTATPAAFYTVVYNSDGLVQFQETWAVPSSAQPLRIRDVRVSGVGALGVAPVVDTIQESDVIGLLSDLGARPLKGPAYAAGRVAFVNETGALETVTGTPADCVRVDGTSGPCGGTQPNFVDGDSPAGLVDGANTAFTLSGVPSPAPSLTMYRNGMLQKPVQDFTLSGNQIQFAPAAAPQPGDTLLASYRVAGGATDAPQLYPNPQVLCSGLGAATNASTLASIGTCTIPAALLTAGDRVEIRFDLDHAGTAGGFSFAVLWGATTVLARNASAADAQAAGRADAALTAAGAQLSHQSWGTSLAFAAGVGKSTVDPTAGVTVNFQALTALPAESVTLRNFTVVRFP
jgi:hypothetical protein